MNLKDIETSIEFTIWFHPQNCNIEIDETLSQLKLHSENEMYSFIQNKKFLMVKAKEKVDNKDLSFYIQKGLTNLCQVIQKAPDDSVLIKINFFNGAIVDMDKVDIGIDEEIEKGLKKKGLKFRDTKGLNREMIEKFSFKVYTPTDKANFFLMLSGEASKDDYADEIENDVKFFTIYSDNMKIPVIKKQMTKEKVIYFASKVMPNKNKNQEGALRLVKANLIFSDFKTTGEPQAIIRGAMEKLLKDENSYLNKWDEYGDKELEILILNAQKVGFIKYDKVEPQEIGIKLFFEESIVDRLSVGLELEIIKDEPFYIKNKNITPKEFNEYLEKEEELKTTSKNKNSSKTIIVKIKKIEEKSILIESSSNDKINRKDLEGQKLTLSINGERIQIERRQKARKRVLEGRSANPQLGLIIEENGELLPISRVSKIKPLSTFVKNKIFKNEPTSIQIKSIDIALNTPDITLIQGPPGTGKTTVVTAIIERLNQEHNKSNSIRGQVLVTGFQHDAVENIISRLRINDLPTIKFGNKKTSNKDEIMQSQRVMVEGIVNSLKEKNPTIKQFKEYEELSKQFISYVTLPSLHNAKLLLLLALKLPSSIIEKDETIIINQILKEITSMSKKIVDENKIKTIRALRIKEESFLDDGKERASDCLSNFEEDLNELEHSSLKKAILWREGRDFKFLSSLKQIKIKLLNLYLPQKEYKREKPRKDILELIKTLEVKLKKETTRFDKKEKILSEFLYELENNPLSIEEAISDYNYVFSATTQQSEGKDIRKAKKKFNENEFLEYDTIIVDEAARVSPRDLLIPMVQAKKRIILVGDHRQLPHIIDEEIVKALEEETEPLVELKKENEYIKTSMFAYLFKRLKSLESKDKIQRTITLDAQYRMHPLLGKFTSDNFYKQYGEGYKSPLGEECFIQNLKGLNGKSAIWLNVSHTKGSESRDNNKSRYRKAEAEAIAIQLKKWIDSTEGKKLTFGVISFYRGQVNSIFDALEKYEVTKNREVVDKYKYLEGNSSQERLRINTVDSFQGMEFDIVFLSMVRTATQNQIKNQLKKKGEEKASISTFGHLMSENRLCVSVSRQKKVLIIVGDGNLVNLELSQKKIPALYNFYNLAKTKGVILDEDS